MQGRCIGEQDRRCVLHEVVAPYNAHFGPKKGIIRAENTCFWELSVINNMLAWSDPQQFFFWKFKLNLPALLNIYPVMLIGSYKKYDF